MYSSCVVDESLMLDAADGILLGPWVSFLCVLVSTHLSDSPQASHIEPHQMTFTAIPKDSVIVANAL
jgi:hypothetical protein